ncbi:hypothetical protein BSG1_00340 [Bacillus sp. SG-1]|nr:GNAT family N-acetyltransferase [Bacillus sp. SG-1]EDL65500.1 hypothetical protein BSG1_00340 [Bacillus sp. SG-1]
MIIISKAQITDLDEIVAVDSEVIGSKARSSIIREAIKTGQCLAAKENDTVGGFLIYNLHFFECTFISLVIVSPPQRRRGYASRLIESMFHHSPTPKIFSSTNRSNLAMQRVFAACGFQPSGIVENLDEGDPELIYFKRIAKE